MMADPSRHLLRAQREQSRFESLSQHRIDPQILRTVIAELQQGGDFDLELDNRLHSEFTTGIPLQSQPMHL